MPSDAAMLLAFAGKETLAVIRCIFQAENRIVQGWGVECSAICIMSEPQDFALKLNLHIPQH